MLANGIVPIDFSIIDRDGGGQGGERLGAGRQWKDGVSRNRAFLAGFAAPISIQMLQFVALNNHSAAPGTSPQYRIASRTAASMVAAS